MKFLLSSPHNPPLGGKTRGRGKEGNRMLNIRLPITIADDPLSAVAEGTGKFIQENSRIFEDEN